MFFTEAGLIKIQTIMRTHPTAVLAALSALMQITANAQTISGPTWQQSNAITSVRSAANLSNSAASMTGSVRSHDGHRWRLLNEMTVANRRQFCQWAAVRCNSRP
jgi:hypothetical protein